MLRGIVSYRLWVNVLPGSQSSRPLKPNGFLELLMVNPYRKQWSSRKNPIQEIVDRRTSRVLSEWNKACLGGAIFFLRQAHECIDRRTKEAVHLGVKCLKLWLLPDRIVITSHLTGGVACGCRTSRVCLFYFLACFCHFFLIKLFW